LPQYKTRLSRSRGVPYIGSWLYFIEQTKSNLTWNLLNKLEQKNQYQTHTKLTQTQKSILTPYKISHESHKNPTKNKHLYKNQQPWILSTWTARCTKTETKKAKNQTRPAKILSSPFIDHSRQKKALSVHFSHVNQNEPDLCGKAAAKKRSTQNENALL
jgi:hypothetical protein